MPIGQRTVPTRIGVNLRAIQRHGAELEHPHRARELQHFDEQGPQLRQEALAKGFDRVVIGMLVVGDIPKRHRVVGRSLNRPARKYLCRIAIHQQHRRVIRRRARAPVGFDQFRQIQSVNHFHHEASPLTIQCIY
jgi:hypothetical protein